MSTHAIGTDSANITNEVGTFVANRILRRNDGDLEEDHQSRQIVPPFEVFVAIS